MSHPVIHALEVAAPEDLAGQPGGQQPGGQQPGGQQLGGQQPGGQQPVGVRMNDVPGKPGTRLGLGLRCTQAISSIIALSFMVSTKFTTVPAFCFLVAAAGLNCVWSIPLAFADLHALLVGRHLRKRRLVQLFTIGDAIVGLILYIAASAAGGISVWISHELELCSIKECAIFRTSVVFAFISFFALSPSFFLNLSSWVSFDQVV